MMQMIQKPVEHWIDVSLENRDPITVYNCGNDILDALLRGDPQLFTELS